ncbi:MAG: hypothetical protein JNL80_15575 [Phycisphaerae bacterium]|jgi:hypothetical protein|nr:hypothetical protein [Phycisphaerae bacterium]
MSHSLSIIKRCATLLLGGSLLSSASPAWAGFESVSADVTFVTHNGSPHALVEVYTVFSQPTDTLLSVYDWQGPILPRNPAYVGVMRRFEKLHDEVNRREQRAREDPALSTSR